MLPEADFDITQAAMEQHRLSNPRYQGDENLYVKFYYRAIQDKKESEQEGRPIFKDKAFVQIMVPGDKGNVIDRPIQEDDPIRWPKQWQAFKNQEEQGQEGTPLSEWPGISRSQVEELKFFHVYTVEALASLSDSQAQKFMGINMLKQKAKDWIELSSSNAPMEQLRATNEEQTNEIETLKVQMAEMADELKKLKEKKGGK